MRPCILISAICILTSSGFAGSPGFDPNDVVRRVGVRSEPSAASREPFALDDGEFLIDTSICHIPAPGDQWDPAIAFDGTNYLVVWTDGRSGSSYADIYGTRVTPGGAVLDPAGIPISQAANSQQSPAVSFDGTNFLVVWGDERRGGSSDIYGSRVTPGGAVLDPQGIPISQATYNQVSPAVSFDGTSFLVVWDDNRRGECDIYGARLSQAGNVLDPAGIPISSAAYGQHNPALAFDGTNFLVVWKDWRNIWSADIYGARMTSGGAVLDPSGIVISATSDNKGEPAVASDGSTSFVVWSDGRGSRDEYDIYGARVNRAGAVVDTTGVAISRTARYQTRPAIAFDGTNHLVVWQDGRNDGIDVYGTRLTQAGIVLEPAGIAMATAAADQWFPAVAFDQANFLVVWQDARSGPCENDICGARVSPVGAVIDPGAFTVAWTDSNQTSPCVAFDGDNYLVAWEDSYQGAWSSILGARVTTSGTLPDTQVIPISLAPDWQLSPDLAFDGTDFLAVWRDWRSGITLYDIYASRVTPSGAVLEPQGIPVSTAESYQQSPDIAFDGAEFLVVWEDWRGPDIDIYGARVTPSGLVLDTAGVRISAEADDQSCPAIAFDGTRFLVVWQDRRGGLSYDIYGARVSCTGVVLDSSGFVVSRATGDQVVPSIAFDGTNFLVVWEDRRDDHSDIYGARVTPDGAVFDEGPIVLQEGSQRCPALAHGPGNQLFLVYQGWAGTVGNKTYNTYRIWGKMNPGVEERENSEVRRVNVEPTLVRGVLFLPEANGEGRAASSELLDISGRKVLDLAPGPNDVSLLAPGVYFVRSEPSAVSRQPSAVSCSKVMIVR